MLLQTNRFVFYLEVNDQKDLLDFNFNLVTFVDLKTNLFGDSVFVFNQLKYYMIEWYLSNKQAQVSIQVFGNFTISTKIFVYLYQIKEYQTFLLRKCTIWHLVSIYVKVSTNLIDKTIYQWYNVLVDQISKPKKINDWFIYRSTSPIREYQQLTQTPTMFNI